MKDYSFYNRAIKLDPQNAGKYYAGRAVLYFYDMEYELAWNDFQKAKELGAKVETNYYYKILKFSKNSTKEDLVTNIEKTTSFQQIFNSLNCYLVQRRYADAYKIMGLLFSANLTVNNKCFFDSFALKKINKVIFEIEKSKYKTLITQKPRYESPYFSRINLYSKYFDEFSKIEKKFYRQRINQDFDTLEKISKNPEYICLFRSKYFEKRNEIRYAIKFCQKAIDIAKNKQHDGFAYIATSILKDLYIKDYNMSKALELATELVENKPLPATLSKAVISFNYIPKLFQYKFPPEFQKYKKYRLIVNNLKENAKKRLAMLKRKRKMKNKKGCTNGKNNGGK